MRNVVDRIRHLKYKVDVLGVVGTILYYRGRHRHRSGHTAHAFPLTSKTSRHPLFCRPGTSDLDVFIQVYLDQEYLVLDGTQNVSLVVDCGANVGFSSAFFLSRFPSCKLIAIEPDPGNFSMLAKNLSPFDGRTTLLQAAVWSHSGGLVIAEHTYRDGQEWSRQVRPCRPDETPSVKAVDIASLLDESGFPRISILKIDIEGAESVLFSSGYEKWIDRVDTMTIELHDDTEFGPCSDTVRSVILQHGFEISESHELTICKRLG